MSINARAAGVHEQKDPATTAKRFPGAKWTREFIPASDISLSRSGTAEQLIAAVKREAAPGWSVNQGGAMVSLKLDIAAAARGDWDAELVALGAALKGRRIVLVIWHEPENDFAPAAFAAGFNAAREALKRGWPELRVAYAAMAYQWARIEDPGAWREVDADLYLVDVYSGKSFPGSAILPEHAGWRRWYDEIVGDSGRVWGVAERGIAAGPERVRTIRREADWLAEDRIGQTCAFYLWWNTVGKEHFAGWLLDPAGEEAVADLIARFVRLPALHA